MTQATEIQFLGAPPSPYTRKMLGLVRYRKIPYRVIWGGHQNPPEGLPVPKVKLLPTFYFPDEAGNLEAVVDSTPIIRRLEKQFAGRSVIPSDPEVAFYNDLIEDFADEWITKQMFHYRWYFEADRNNAGPLLIYWSNNTVSDEDAEKLATYIIDRQFGRLYVVGSNDVTAGIIEDSYTRLIAILDKLLSKKGFVLGSRPSSADFAIYGQFTQLGIVEPTSAAILSRLSPRLRAWIDIMEDLSGLSPQEGDWFTAAEARAHLKPLLEEIGRVYVPFLRANAKAVMTQKDSFETLIDGRTWTQPTFPYQAKCLAALRQTYQELPLQNQPDIRATLQAAGCDGLFADERAE